VCNGRPGAGCSDSDNMGELRSGRVTCAATSKVRTFKR
jgi:transposase-like protein